MRAKRSKNKSLANLPNLPTANNFSDSKMPSSADAENVNMPEIQTSN